MARWVVHNCITLISEGGYVTRFMNHTVDYLLRPETHFLGPMRESTSFPAPVAGKLSSKPCLLTFTRWAAAEKTYLSLRVGNADQAKKWNPGNLESFVAESIHDIVDQTSREAPQSSWLRHDLGRRAEYIYHNAMVYQFHVGKCAWWVSPTI